MSMLPIGALTSIATPSVTGAKSPAGPDGTDFSNVMGKAIDSLTTTQAKADELSVAAATGDLNDVHDYMIAATEASIATELTVAVRNKAVEAFTEVMRMQI